MALDRSRQLLLAALMALPVGAHAQLYVCTTPGGRTLTGDLPPPECQNVQIRELNRDGSVRRIIEPPLTPDQRKKRDEEDKARRERERGAQEQLRKDRALLEAYAGEDEIESARDRVLAERQALIERANQQLKEYRADHKRLEDESEFYAKRTLPDKLKRALADNTELQEQLRHQIEEIRADMQRINERYDADLRRYRELVLRGATPVQRKTDP
jgi:DNA repair exonuclease SbcCD ATPase subunit